MWIITSWHHISPEVAVKVFRKSCLSNAVDGTDDDMLWNGSEEDGDGRNVCEKDEVTD